jgi:hypothetical protein
LGLTAQTGQLKGLPVTVDEELSMLEDSLRRLKIEFDVYFGGGSKKPPTDLEWRVQSLIKKYNEGSKLTYAQRFRYNAMAQRFALFSDLWRQKLKIKEEGYRRPQDAMLGITGLRGSDEELPNSESVVVNVTKADDDEISQLFDAMKAAREKAGLPVTGTLDSFKSFVQIKTEQIREQFSCETVEYTVEAQDGQVRLKAKARK